MGLRLVKRTWNYSRPSSRGCEQGRPASWQGVRGLKEARRIKRMQHPKLPHQQQRQRYGHARLATSGPWGWRCAVHHACLAVFLFA